MDIKKTIGRYNGKQGKFLVVDESVFFVGSNNVLEMLFASENAESVLKEKASVGKVMGKRSAAAHHRAARFMIKNNLSIENLSDVYLLMQCPLVQSVAKESEILYTVMSNELPCAKYKVWKFRGETFKVEGYGGNLSEAYQDMLNKIFRGDRLPNSIVCNVYELDQSKSGVYGWGHLYVPVSFDVTSADGHLGSFRKKVKHVGVFTLEVAYLDRCHNPVINEDNYFWDGITEE